MVKYWSAIFMSIVLVSCNKSQSSDKVSDAVKKATFEAIKRNTVSGEAKIQIKNIVQSATNFYQQNGIMPGDCYEEMQQYGLIEMKQSVIDAWEFQCDWFFDDDDREIVGMISATSTEANEAGAGKTIVYDILSGTFTGYGIE
tara:strand:- start:390 stop:818 length:429 start_codon:yes stop_codon:yes gene_type:complete